MRICLRILWYFSILCSYESVDLGRFVPSSFRNVCRIRVRFTCAFSKQHLGGYASAMAWDETASRILRSWCLMMDEPYWFILFDYVAIHHCDLKWIQSRYCLPARLLLKKYLLQSPATPLLAHLHLLSPWWKVESLGLIPHNHHSLHLHMLYYSRILKPVGNYPSIKTTLRDWIILMFFSRLGTFLKDGLEILH